ncbi:hypothetical protein [Streptomyces antibioticus]|uniref:hypothetical protein n=1 Tax=Streptomyces antibioticus TaxID=1890 RepID=UPI001960DD91|nr:hypothetical protein [Streptomyces sp. S9]
MSVVWAATSPESGSFLPAEQHTDVEALSDRIGDLRSRGQGYVEVRSPGEEFPVLTLAFRGDHAVVHLMSDPERTSLLVGDGSAPSGAEVEVLIVDDLAVFSGDFVLHIDRAWELVHDFTQTWAAAPLGEWCAL